MKLLLRDYISSLRERSELDRVLMPLLIASDLRVVREPELGIPDPLRLPPARHLPAP